MGRGVLAVTLQMKQACDSEGRLLSVRVRLHFSELHQRWQVTLKKTRPAHTDGSQLWPKV